MAHVELDSTERTTVRVKVQVRKIVTYPGNKRRTIQYVAKLGNLDAIADTPVAAKAALAEMVELTIGELVSPTVMFDLVEPQTAWIASAGVYGWSYSITRHHGMGRSLSNSTGGSWTRDECITRMRDHWYANNAELIVNGIVALCTSWREWACIKCSGANRSFAPYVCRNPACGHATEEKAK